MVSFNKADVILSNVARITESRTNADITLVVDNSMSEFEGKIENGVFTAGSHSQLLYLVGKFLRNPEETKKAIEKSGKDIINRMQNKI